MIISSSQIVNFNEYGIIVAKNSETHRCEEWGETGILITNILKNRMADKSVKNSPIIARQMQKLLRATMMPDPSI